jgi:hypothetical protein
MVTPNVPYVPNLPDVLLVISQAKEVSDEEGNLFRRAGFQTPDIVLV